MCRLGMKYEDGGSEHDGMFNFYCGCQIPVCIHSLDAILRVEANITFYKS
jgi:hypothetical protein